MILITIYNLHNFPKLWNLPACFPLNNFLPVLDLTRWPPAVRVYVGDFKAVLRYVELLFLNMAAVTLSIFLPFFIAPTFVLGITGNLWKSFFAWLTFAPCAFVIDLVMGLLLPGEFWTFAAHEADRVVTAGARSSNVVNDLTSIGAGKTFSRVAKRQKKSKKQAAHYKENMRRDLRTSLREIQSAGALL